MVIFLYNLYIFCLDTTLILTKVYRFYRNFTINGHFSIESIQFYLDTTHIQTKMYSFCRKWPWTYGHFSLLTNLYIFCLNAIFLGSIFKPSYIQDSAIMNCVMKRFLCTDIFVTPAIDLDLHCLQRQGISRFSRTRVNWIILFTKKSTCKLSVQFFPASFSHTMQTLGCSVAIG